MPTTRRFFATLGLLLLSACLGDDTSDGPPSALEVVDGAGQTAQVGRAVGTPPSVRVIDDRGTPLSGVVVIFSTEAGFGTVTGASATSDSAGIATVGSWTLGTVVGEQRLTAEVQSLDVKVRITAMATAGPPAGIVAIAPSQFATLVSTAVTPVPTVYVTDAFGNPQPGATVTWTVLVGGGTITGGPTTVTGANGRSTIGSWTVGVAAGNNRLEARIASGARIYFDAQALASAPTQIVATSPVSQNGVLGFQVEKTPRVIVRNASGQALPGVPVTFTLVTGGDAVITGASAVTGADGIAALGDWELGTVTSTSSVQATINGFPGPVATFQASGTAQPFVIDLRLLNTMLPNYRDAVVGAALRWMNAITGALPSVNIELPEPGLCGPGTPAFSGPVPNMIIYIQATAIDGPLGIIASAGPCVRRIPSYHTAIGSMRLDTSDLALMDSSGRLFSVILHEMGHVLGFGTSWSEKGLVSGLGGTEPLYTGTNALSLWSTFSMGYGGTPIPLETEGGSGTRDAHWKKTVFGPELMTGYVEPAGNPMPLSKLTLAVLKDFGYSVNYGAADSYRGNLYANFGSGATTPFNETLETARFNVSADGKVTAVPGAIFRP